jgi:predicted nucleic acid-binding protein
MNSVIVLDSGPLGLICNPNPNPLAIRCQTWLNELVLANCRIILPEIADYEIRRSLVANRSLIAIDNLDGLREVFEYLPVSTDMWRLAAELWAQARQGGYPTAANHDLDADVILAAQALSLDVPVVVATANVRHLSRFVRAEEWQTITP